MIPQGFKLIAWEGTGLYVPDRWDLGRYWGDDLHGGFRVDSELRPAVDVRWWKTRGKARFEPLIRQHVPALSKKRDREALDLRRVEAPFPADLADQAVMYQTPPEAEEANKAERVVVLQTADQKRAVMYRFFLEDDEPNAAMIATMLSGLRATNAHETRDWAIYEMRFQSPAGWRLDHVSMAVGVCRFAFRSRRRRVALRRFSAADAVIGTATYDMDELEKWLRAIYAPEFFDMKYDVERTESGVVLTGRRRLGRSIEWYGLFPRFRRSPRRIDVIWDGQRNKVWCVETNTTEPEAAFIASISHQASSPGETITEARTHREASLAAYVRQSSEVRESGDSGAVRLHYTLRRTLRLRALRLLAGQPGEKIQHRTTELDAMGADLWRTCADPVRVCELIERMVIDRQISYREAELSVTHYVRWLGERGILKVGQ